MGFCTQTYLVQSSSDIIVILLGTTGRPDAGAFVGHKITDLRTRLLADASTMELSAGKKDLERFCTDLEFFFRQNGQPYQHAESHSSQHKLVIVREWPYIIFDDLRWDVFNRVVRRLDM